MEMKNVKLYKPRYIGSSILALSKTLMFDFHYSYMQKTFKNCKLLFQILTHSVIVSLKLKIFMKSSRTLIGLTFQTFQKITEVIVLPIK